MPSAHLSAGVAEDPLEDVADQPLVLGERDEGRRAEQPPARVVPADQGFGAGDAPVGEGDDRLVADLELMPVEGAAQLRLELGLHRLVVVRPRVEHGAPPLARGLRRVHGQVGAVQQVAGVLQPRHADGDADAGAHPHLFASDGAGRLEHPEEPLADRGPALGLLQPWEALDQDSELVAGQSGDAGRPTQRCA